MNLLHAYTVGPAVVSLIQAASRTHALLLVSPYFKPWGALDNAIQNALSRRDHKNAPLIMVVRGGNNRAKNEEATAPYKALGAKILYVDRLHAKFFFSNDRAILGSMNLLKSSAVDSWEIAIQAERGEDPELFQSVAQASNELIQLGMQEQGRRQERSTWTKLSAIAAALAPRSSPSRATTKKPASPSRRRTRKKTPAAPQAHCIRCAEAIPLDTDKPHCRDCWESWAEYNNDEYPEKYCHSCGKPKKTSKAKPQCKPCWSAA